MKRAPSAALVWVLGAMRAAANWSHPVTGISGLVAVQESGGQSVLQIRDLQGDIPVRKTAVIWEASLGIGDRLQLRRRCCGGHGGRGRLL